MYLCWQSDVSAFNMLFRFVITFPPRSKCLWISWLQSPSAVILEPKKICPCFHFIPFYLPWSDGTWCHDLSFLNVEFQASLFTLLFHFHLEALQFLFTFCTLHDVCGSHPITWRACQVAPVVKNPPANAGDKRCGFNPWVGKIPWRRAWQPTPVFMSGESHGQKILVGYSPWGHKELDKTEVTWHTARMCPGQEGILPLELNCSMNSCQNLSSANLPCKFQTWQHPQSREPTA